MGWSFNSGLECRGSMQQTSPLEPLNRHLDSHVLTPITLLKTSRHHNQCSENPQPDQQPLLAPVLTTASPHCTGQICHCSSRDTLPRLNPLRAGSCLHSSPATSSLAGILQPRWLLCTPMCALCWEVCPLPLIFICWIWSLSSFLPHVTFYPRLPELQQVQASAMVYLLTPFKSTQVRAFIFQLYLSPHAHQLFCKEPGLWLVLN